MAGSAALLLAAAACLRHDAGTARPAASQQPPTLSATVTPVSDTAPPARSGEPQAPNGRRLEPDSLGGLVYRGPGFTLRVPAGSTLNADDTPDASGMGDILRGPELQRSGRDMPAGEPGPYATFGFQIRTFPNPEHRPLAAWVDSVRRAEGAEGGPDEPVGAAVPDSVGSVAALRLNRFCGDCRPVELYVARADRIVAISYTNSLFHAGSFDEQERVHRAILATLRWTE